MLDAQALVALRSVAAVAMVVPTVGAVVRASGREVIVVPGAAGGGAQSLTAVVLKAASFRLAVSAAYAAHRGGGQAELPGIACDPPVVVEIQVASDDAVLPGGIYRCRLDDRVWQGFTTTLDQTGARHAATDGAPIARGPAAAAAPPGFANVQLQHDEALGITVVQGQSALDDPDAARDVTESLKILLARCCAHELLAATRTTEA